MSASHRKLALSLTFLFFFPPGISQAATLKPEAQQSWSQYVALTEERISRELEDPKRFLWLYSLSPGERQVAEKKLEQGQVIVEKLKTLRDGKAIAAPGALIHHWVGTAFIPGANIARALALLQDYDHHAEIYAPEVERSRLISRKGDDFQVFLRFRKKKIITVVLNTDHDAHYVRMDAVHAHSRSRTTRIAEVDDAGTPQEKERPLDKQQGFMWKLNTYWRFEESNGGLYVQCEALTLTRDLPFGLGWMIEPFITSIPKESLEFTMNATRKALTK